MSVRLFSAVALSVLLGATSALAQSVASVGGPAELPPPGFKGQQYVDSRGCVFVKAGLGGQVNWVVRVGANRKPMCNQTPTFGAKAAIEVAEEGEVGTPPVVEVAEAAPEPAPVVKAKPVPAVTLEMPVTVAAAPAPAPVVVPAAPQPEPVTQMRVKPGYEVASGAGGARQIGCYTSAPVAERVRLTNGGTAVVCTRGDGTLSGWRPPVYADGAGVGAALSDPPVEIVGHSHGKKAKAHAADDHAHASNGSPKPPKGYKLAWDDDRLNPKRGKGTAAGWAAQDQVWTRDVPAEAVPTVKKKRVAGSASNGDAATAKTKTQVATKTVATGGRSFIQVGTFGVPANAEGASSRLQALGLPVARSKTTRGGKALQIVLAGPFASAAEAQAALSAVRGAGFGDAFVR